MDRPFREVHELYKILYQRAEAQQKEAEEREKKEKEEEQKKHQKNGSNKQQPTDASSTIPTPSPLEMEALEEMFEDMM
jgi:hypothetical protein